MLRGSSHGGGYLNVRVWCNVLCRNQTGSLGARREDGRDLVLVNDLPLLFGRIDRCTDPLGRIDRYTGPLR